MDKPILTAENLGKSYQLGRQLQKEATFRDAIASAVKAPFRRLRARAGEETGEKFWALKDVSFEVKQGEMVGVIGRNGAGKSTLLKVLSRITEPTEGRATLRGRVASLLEVGTGFHPELSGRENVYLNGSILGMTRAEIAKKFDEIVAFSEVEKFLDTPVKYYSSGMYVRLAFAVAAHLDPEILIVDEVLAVGDVQFQKKCMGKMQQVASGQGRTVLFVSHNMSAVQRLCPRSILMRKGSVAFDGPTDDVVRQFLTYLNETAAVAFDKNPERSGSGTVRLTSARALDGEGNVARGLVAGRPASFEFAYANPGRARFAHFAVTVFNHLGDAATQLDTWFYDNDPIALADQGTLTASLPTLPLPPGEYRMQVSINPEHGGPADLLPNALVFTVETSVFYPTMNAPAIHNCSVMVEHGWSHRAGPEELNSAPAGSAELATELEPSRA
jgi:lipopolysaccharide transport system ATP-binding protein